MIRGYLSVLIACTLYIPSMWGQETQSLADVARKVRAESSAKKNAAAPGRVATPRPTSDAKEITPDLHPNVATDLRGIDKFQAAIRELLLQDKFEALDQIANEARDTKAKFPGGFWKIHLIYPALQAPGTGDQASDSEWMQHLARLERWVRQRPNSITARVALGWFYYSYGWKARGPGYSNTVTEEGWQLLAERVEKARNVLEEARALPTKCPEWFLAMQQIAVSANWDRDKLDALFEQAIAFEPDYYYYYRIQAQSLMAKWGGDDADMVKFAESLAGRIGGKKGDLVYYQIGAQIICGCDNDRQLIGMSWPRLKSGYATLEELYGSSIAHMNKMAYMASIAGDDDYAKALFTRVGDNWDKEVWRTHDDFVFAKAKVEGAPLRRAYAEATENLKTQEGHLFGEALMAALNKDYHAKLMECMTTAPKYQLPVVGLLMQLAKDGSVQQLFIVPTDAPTECFRPQLDKATFPAPPRADYWVVANMDVTR